MNYLCYCSNVPPEVAHLALYWLAPLTLTYDPWIYSYFYVKSVCMKHVIKREKGLPLNRLTQPL